MFGFVFAIILILGVLAVGLVLCTIVPKSAWEQEEEDLEQMQYLSALKEKWKL